MTKNGEPVVVVGAGFAGLSAAVRLAGEGRKVVLVEATGKGGGRSRSFAHNGSGWELDNGQHLMMGCYFETLAFLRAIGAEHGVQFQRNLAIDMVKPGGGRVKLRCPALPAPLHLAAGLLSMRGIGVVSKAAALLLSVNNTAARMTLPFRIVGMHSSSRSDRAPHVTDDQLGPPAAVAIRTR